MGLPGWPLSGRFANTDAVVWELHSRGFDQIGKITGSKYAREQIDSMCRPEAEEILGALDCPRSSRGTVWPFLRSVEEC